MPPIQKSKLKQHRSAISDDVKRQICEWEKANRGKRHAEIAAHFNETYPHLNMDRSTISKILSQRDKWEVTTGTEDTAQIFRHKEVKFPVLEQAMNLWVENVTTGGVILTDLLIKEKAKIFAEAFNIQEKDLAFSNGWLHKFKKRNNICRYRIHGESGSAPLASLPEERRKLHQLLEHYTLDRIYNIDETVRIG
jgi:Tc5 transposase DNA-binding domain/Fission yeast centromere protein N-terminal domain